MGLPQRVSHKLPGIWECAKLLRNDMDLGLPATTALYLLLRFGGLARGRRRTVRSLQRGIDLTDPINRAYRKPPRDYFNLLETSFTATIRLPDSTSSEGDRFELDARVVYALLQTFVASPRSPIFGRHLCFSTSKDNRISAQIFDGSPRGDWIAISSFGQCFGLKVVRRGELVPFHYIRDGLRHIYNRAEKAGPSSSGIPITTSSIDVTTLDRLDSLVRTNPRFHTVLSRSIFWVTLAPTPAGPRDRIWYYQQSHIERSVDRNWLHSLQVHLYGTHTIGLTFNHEVGLDGRHAVDLAKALSDRFQRQRNQATGGQPPPRVTRLIRIPLDATPAVERKVQLDYAGHRDINIDSACNTFTDSRLNAHWFRHTETSFDATFHLALHLAYAACYGNTPTVAEFIDISALPWGRLVRHVTTQKNMAALYADPTRESITRFLTQHVDRVRAIKRTGTGLGLYAYYNAAHPDTTGNVFRCAYERIIGQYLKTQFTTDIIASSISLLSGLELAGRPNTRLSYLTKGQLAIHYNLGDQYLALTINRDGSSQADLALLADSIFRHIRSIQTCLS